MIYNCVSLLGSYSGMVFWHWQLYGYNWLVNTIFIISVNVL